jgi:valyl-tRNA synthetase
MTSIYGVQSSLQTKNITNKDEQIKKLNKKLDKVIIELDSLKNKIENPEYEIKAPEIAKEKDRYVI